MSVSSFRSESSTASLGAAASSGLGSNLLRILGDLVPGCQPSRGQRCSWWMVAIRIHSRSAARAKCRMAWSCNVGICWDVSLDPCARRILEIIGFFPPRPRARSFRQGCNFRIFFAVPVSWQDFLRAPLQMFCPEVGDQDRRSFSGMN